jgi:hypothetical protein
MAKEDGGVWHEMVELGGGTDWVVILGFFVENPMEWVLEIFTVGVCKWFNESCF